MKRVGSALVLVAVMATAAPAQRAGYNSTVINNVPYNGQFTYARIKYEASYGGFGFGRRGYDLMWNHDFQTSDIHLPKILEALTTMQVRTTGSNVFTFDDPELFRYTFAYLCEIGAWQPTEAEVLGARNWLTKGGFLLVDDFRGRDADNLVLQLQRILPKARLLPIPRTHPIWNSFYQITDDDLAQLAGGPGGRFQPSYYGVFEDNDPAKRLMLVADVDGDISEFWEFSASGRFAIDPTNDAYKVGVNYVMYSLTH